MKMKTALSPHCVTISLGAAFYAVPFYAVEMPEKFESESFTRPHSSLCKRIVFGGEEKKGRLAG